jgi:hypothetical protein
VARSAVDIESLLAAGHDVFGDGERERIDRFAVGPHAGVESHIVIQMAAGHGAVDEGALGAAVVEEGGGPQGDELGLVLHVLAASGEGEESEGKGDYRSLAVAALYRTTARMGVMSHDREGVVLWLQLREQLQIPPSAPAFPETRTYV